MSANASYSFLGYTLRPATEGDADMARAWTKADPAHADTIAPRFWIEQDAGVDCYLLSDEQGPLFFFRMQRAVRLLIQFSPSTGEDHDARTRKGLDEGLRWLSAALAVVSVTEIIFDSASTLLRRYVTGRLGFQPKRETLIKTVQRSVCRPADPLRVDMRTKTDKAPEQAQPYTLQEGD